MHDSQLSSILSHWPAPFAAGRSLQRHEGFSGATVMQLEVMEQQYALKGWPSGAQTAERLAAIHAFQLFLFEQGLHQVPVPIPLRNFGTFVTVHHRLWQLEPWMPGSANFHADPRPEKLKNLMSLLARLHLVAGEYHPDDNHQRWLTITPDATSPTIIERLHFLEQWSDTDPNTIERLLQRKPLPESLKTKFREIMALFRANHSLIRGELQYQLSFRYLLQPCLRDLWHDHVLFMGESITGLIDFGSCRSENPMIDLSRLLGSLVVQNESLWEQALRWYEEVRTITPAERLLLRTFDRSQRVLAGMTWIERLVLKGEPIQKTDAIEARLDYVLVRMRAVPPTAS